MWRQRARAAERPGAAVPRGRGVATGAAGGVPGRPRGRRATRLGVALVPLALLLPACSQYKKLSAGGSPTEVLFYDILGQDRGALHYYELVRDSHDKETFCYECGADPYLVDKNIDAIQHLGTASYGRLEGQAEVVELLTEVLLEDRSSLARSTSATSLTQIGARLPVYPDAPIPDRGDRLLRDMKALDALYANGSPRALAGGRAQAIRLITEVGNLHFDDLLTTKNAVRLFYGRDYLIDETDPELRSAIDTALTKRTRRLVVAGLVAAVEDPAAQVRADAIRGLKVLDVRTAREDVVLRLEVESHLLVRLEACEYLGRVGGRAAVQTLVPMLDDASLSVRTKARDALIRIAHEDHGWRRSAWERWARGLDPGLTFPDQEGEGAAEEDVDLPGLR